ncbi:kinase-like domain-containing protein [Gigaspora rosea]|uniref:Kinase-like domain-containing protein n=1 Tax=Gigaspora rosea TaxID=44941 RepID=A0A397UQK9_9GLOM|nr:kinase-like domain-containing protein [Gigaspora rosea]
MKELQLGTDDYESMIEWIPFDRLNNIEKIGEGGFGSVFSAIWLNGKRKIITIKDDDDNYEYIRSRKHYSTVALKTLSGSKENPRDFLKEFENHVKCRLYGSRLNIFGLTQNTATNEYLMVFQYADNGSLHKFLRMKFQDLTWQIKLKLLEDISYDLDEIHKAGYIHADFHSGNILQDESISKWLRSYISDLGLSKKVDGNDSEDGTYGVLPYVAPEVLLG